jgi:hypothetical protein
MTSLPECINTESEQQMQAHRLAVSIWGQTVVSAKRVSVQGLEALPWKSLWMMTLVRLFNFGRRLWI